MAKERPKNYPKLKDYKPSRFMLPEYHYDEGRADRAVRLSRISAIPRADGAGNRSGCFPGRNRSYGMCSGS